MLLKTFGGVIDKISSSTTLTNKKNDESLLDIWSNFGKLNYLTYDYNNSVFNFFYNMIRIKIVNWFFLKESYDRFQSKLINLINEPQKNEEIDKKGTFNWI